MRRIIADADAPATFAVAISSAQPVAPWPTPKVTLLGDAIHTMSPGRGDGANIALKDAQVLVRALQRVASGTAPLASATGGYQAEMLQYGLQAVAESRDNPFLPMARRPSASARSATRTCGTRRPDGSRAGIYQDCSGATQGFVVRENPA